MLERIPLPLAQADYWSTWPFGGFGETFLPAAARTLFVVAIFAAIAFFLRWLFGPGGRLRPPEFGTGHIAERKARKARIKELRQRCKRGEISLEEFLEGSRRIREGRAEPGGSGGSGERGEP
ncbi:MAG: SHOCT domain-containing protein [Thermodesulfobacteriota bacterium]